MYGTYFLGNRLRETRSVGGIRAGRRVEIFVQKGCDFYFIAKYWVKQVIVDNVRVDLTPY